MLFEEAQFVKKIDLHMHTVSTFSDAPFQFSLDALKQYVAVANLDAIAITNHDVFDSEQFRSIRDALQIIVFAGIEINLEQGHLLLISDGQDLENFQNRANKVSAIVTSADKCISVDEFNEIYGNLDQYLLIPHYDKNPSLHPNTLERLSRHISAGEVSSAKKFIYAVKDEAKLTPVLFSDLRISDTLSRFPARQTYIDCGDLTISAIKQCFQDKGKVALSPSDGNKLLPVFTDGQMLSTGLNRLLGSRSSGKTFTLNKINENNENVKYIKQFSLVQQDDKACKKEFDSSVKNNRSIATEKYLLGFKQVLEGVMDINIRQNHMDVECYIKSLLKFAEQTGMQDIFAKMALFNETAFDVKDDNTLRELIESVRQVIENMTYRKTIEKYVDLVVMRDLACDLIEQLWALAADCKKKNFVDNIVKDCENRA